MPQHTNISCKPIILIPENGSEGINDGQNGPHQFYFYEVRGPGKALVCLSCIKRLSHQRSSSALDLKMIEINKQPTPPEPQAQGEDE